MKQVLLLLPLLLVTRAFAGEPLWYTLEDFRRNCAPWCGGAREQVFIDADREGRAKILQDMTEARAIIRAREAERRQAEEAERKRDWLIQRDYNQREGQHQDRIRIEQERLYIDRERLRVEQEALRQGRRPLHVDCSWFGSTLRCREIY